MRGRSNHGAHGHGRRHAWHHEMHGPGPHGRRWHRRHITLHRVLFFGGFASIAATAAAVMFVVSLSSGPNAWWHEMARFRAFASSQLARTWDDPAARAQLLSDAARDLEVRVVLVDRDGAVLFTGGRPGDCGAASSFAFDVRDDGGHKLGRLTACRPGQHGPPWRGALALAAALSVLWTVSAVFARAAARPIRNLVDVARRIGEGDLRARPRVGRRAVLEVRVLADALSEMADRIETQLRDQRALLAGASHEMRTPLGHLRILVELLRDKPSDKVVDDIEREVLEMDALIEKLLASSRLDFALADKRDVDAVDLARRALERAGEPPDKLTLPVAGPSGTGSEGLRAITVRGDPTLLLGALGNLLENARTHGGGVVRLILEPREDELAFVVEDSGQGVAPEDAERVFEPFFHRGDKGSLGLGLSLVKRIAEAHGGVAFAGQKGGAGRFGFTVARDAPRG